MIPPAPPGPACSVVCPSRVRGSIFAGAKISTPGPQGAALDRQPRSRCAGDQYTTTAEEKRRNFPGTPPISFLERRGVQGGTPCKAPTQHHPAAAVLPVQWQGDNGGLMFTSASRWRRSRRTGQNGGSQAVRPPAGQGGDFRPRRKYYPVLDGHQARAARRTDRLTVRTGGSMRGERPHA